MESSFGGLMPSASSRQRRRRRWRYTLQRADSNPRSFLVEENGVSCDRLSLRTPTRAHAHARACRRSLCSFFPSYRCGPSSFCAVRRRLKPEPLGVSLYRRLRCAPRSYCVTGASERWPARTVPRRQPFFLLSVRAMFSLSSF